MNKLVDTSPQGNPKFTLVQSSIARPFRAIWLTATGLLGNALRKVRANPITWTAILAVAGAACFAARSAHLGAVIVGSIGILWMWQDMLDEAAVAADERGMPESPDSTPLLSLHK